MSHQSPDLPLSYDVYLYHGDTYRRGMRLKNQTTGEYYDLTGATLLGQARETEVSVDPLFSFSFDVADQTDPLTKGLVFFEVDPSFFATLIRFPEYIQVGKYDIQVTWPSGDKITYLEGDVYVKGDVTQ